LIKDDPLKQFYTQFLVVVLLVLSITTSFANETIPLEFGINIGYGLKTYEQKAQTIAVTPALTNAYGAAKSGLAIVGINGSYFFKEPFARIKPLNITLGAGLYSANGRYHGTETPAINYGGGDTLDYKYHSHTLALLLEAKFIYTIQNWQPYLLLGFGPSLNRLAQYSEAPSNPAGSATAIEPYQNHSSVALAYEMGLGVQRQIAPHFIVAADVRNMSFGSEHLTAPKGPYYNDSAKLTANHIGMLGFMLSAFYRL
jgi:opacity protein-like surface antigen